MGILDIFRKKQLPKEEKGKNPLVAVMGYERTYGKPPEKNYDDQVKEYKSWVYACVNKNAFSVAKCNLGLYKVSIGVKGEELTQIYTHPFLELMKNVNPFYNRFELMSLTTMFLELTGNAYWWLVRDGLNVPREIWSIPANWVKVVPDEKKYILGYVVQVPQKGVPIPFNAEDIIHFKYPNPQDLFYGISPLISAGYAIDLNNEIKTWGVNFFKNNAQPSGVLQTDDSLSEQQFNRLRDEWNRKYRGSENSGRLAILEKGLSFQKIGSSLSDMNFSDLGKSVREELCAIFGVPSSMLGLTEAVNRSNAESNEYTYQKETILPKLTLIQEKLNEKFLPIYDINLKVQFDNPVPEDKEMRLREITEHIRAGYSSIDEERVKDDLDPYELPETSAPLLSFSVVPAGTPMEERQQGSSFGTKPEEEEEEDKGKEEKSLKRARRREHKWNMFVRVMTPIERIFKRELQKFFHEQYTEVMSKLGKYKSIGDIKAGTGIDIMFNSNIEEERFKRICKPIMVDAYIAGQEMAGEEVGLDFDWTIHDENAVRAVNHRISNVAKGVIATSRALIVEAIEEKIKNGETIEQLADKLDDIYKFNEHYRSVRIARTETGGAMNEGQLATYRESGSKTKEWVTAGDEKVRESHEDMDGEVVGINEYFEVDDGSGGVDLMQYPLDGDHGASAGNIINCRCTIISME